MSHRDNQNPAAYKQGGKVLLSPGTVLLSSPLQPQRESGWQSRWASVPSDPW